MWGHRLDAEPDRGGKFLCCRAGAITSHPRGVCGRELKPRDDWEGPLGKAAAANRIREIRLSGMRGGPVETWAMAELGTRGTIERVPVGHSPLTAARATVLPDGAADKAASLMG